jgi:hypothetical protein
MALLPETVTVPDASPKPAVSVPKARLSVEAVVAAVVVSVPDELVLKKLLEPHVPPAVPKPAVAPFVSQ